MKYIQQPKGSSLCGHSCLAMLLPCSLEDAIKLIGHKNETEEKELLHWIRCKYTTDYFFGPVRDKYKDCIVLQLHANPKNLKQRHWTVLNKGELLDPANIGEKLWPVFKYWIIYEIKS